MSIQEIEQAITQLSSSEIDQLTEWINEYRANSSVNNIEDSKSITKKITLSEVLGDYIGSVGDPNGTKVSNAANASELFGEYLEQKKSEGRL
jgi:hypothetical protein